ncbi:hypothetical protein P3X46_011723 [Hevea brasiliensis]|uniref:Zinc knuckle CX2CX4HX4C domain-containing protein n=1 Tax=Hevea brasiliensis TaxID=3981 RepID=A0ABQ9MBQ0_HEVBR|nr:hypothetical protein P3X46_011723 [Hevea brasiliensis]
MSFSFESLSLMDEEEESFWFDPLLSEGTPAFSEFCLIGKFLTDRQINLGAICETLASIICLPILSKVDLNRVIEGGPWSFNNHLLITHHLKPRKIPVQVPLIYSEFWVQIHDLPVGFNTEVVAQKLGNFIGKFLFYDSVNSSGGWKTYMRVRIGDDHFHMIHFKYERLPNFCFMCGILGHSDKFCATLFEDQNSSALKGWGPWLWPTGRFRSSNGSRWLRDRLGLMVTFTGRICGIKSSQGFFTDDGRYISRAGSH